MSSTFYPKLALSNIRKNARIYIPYMITCTLTVAMYYIMKSLSLNDGLDSVQGGYFIREMLGFGNYVIAVFSFIFLFYTNSFLTKNRKKEFGLFNILGMEKRHISTMIGYESIFVSLISFVLGIVTGIIFDKLMYLIIINILSGEVTLGFYISAEAIKSSAVIFGILFFVIFLNSLRMIHLSKPIELLKGGNTGEKEPKAKWLLALLGVLLLGSGYYIAVTVKNPVVALELFFIAVILVILGTYLIFTTGSIALLKILKANKRYYYKTSHFINVSGMMYRMKQNAVGLANICILATMVLVTVSPTVSLMAGVNSIIEERYPYQIEMTMYNISKNNMDSIADIMESSIKENGLKVMKKKSYSSLNFSALFDGSDVFRVESQNLADMNNVVSLHFITDEDYSSYIGEEVSLNDSEVIFYSNRLEYNHDSFELFGKKYNIIRHTEKYISSGLMSSDVVPTFGIVVSDISVIEELMKHQADIYGENRSNIISKIQIDTNGNADEQIEVYQKMWDKIAEFSADNENIYIYSECREFERADAFGLYAGLFFLGIFLSVLFTISAVLIIYYKQISEGYDDKKRFEIMQKVGMTEDEVKKSIHSQVLTVFFLPLIVAGIHTAFSFPIMKKMLAMFMLNDTRLYMLCTVASFLIFAVVYGIIYLLTAKIYYKIVKK